MKRKMPLRAQLPRYYSSVGAALHLLVAVVVVALCVSQAAAASADDQWEGVLRRAEQRTAGLREGQQDELPSLKELGLVEQQSELDQLERRSAKLLEDSADDQNDVDEVTPESEVTEIFQATPASVNSELGAEADDDEVPAVPKPVQPKLNLLKQQAIPPAGKMALPI